MITFFLSVIAVVVLTILIVPARFNLSGGVKDGKFRYRFELRYMAVVRFVLSDDKATGISVLGFKKTFVPGEEKTEKEDHPKEIGAGSKAESPIRKILKHAESKGGVESLAKRLFDPVAAFLNRVVSSMRLKLRMRGAWCADDPEIMGELCGVQYALSGLFPCLWSVRPCWEAEKQFAELEGEASGRIVLANLILEAIKLFSNRDVRETIGAMRRSEGG